MLKARAQVGRRIYDQCLQGNHGLRPRLDGAIPCDLDVADHLSSAALALSDRSGLTVQDFRHRDCRICHEDNATAGLVA